MNSGGFWVGTCALWLVACSGRGIDPIAAVDAPEAFASDPADAPARTPGPLDTASALPEENAPSFADATRARVPTVTTLPHDPIAPVVESIPVLLFHSVCAVTCASTEPYGVTRVELARMMDVLQEQGWQSISVADYASWRQGRKTRFVGGKPILITFDDAREDGYVGADDVLAQYGARATMYVITNFVGTDDSKYMTWAQVQAAAASDRWDMQLHAHDGHRRIVIDENGNVAPFFANRAWVDGRIETFEEWHSKVSADIATGNAVLKAKIPGYQPYTFAVPYGDYGYYVSNDPSIAGSMHALLDRQFLVWFTQPHANPAFTTPNGSHEQNRFTIKTTTTAENLSAWLTSKK